MKKNIPYLHFIERKSCPITGQVIKSNSNWHVNDTSMLNRVGVMDDHIILTWTKGHCKLAHTQKYLEVVNEIIDNLPSKEEKVILLEDYGEFDRVDWDARNCYIDSLRSHRQIAGIIFYNVPRTFKINIKAGQFLYKTPFPVEVRDSYSEALKYSYTLLERSHQEIEEKQIDDNFKTNVKLKYGNIALSHTGNQNIHIQFEGKIVSKKEIDLVIEKLDYILKNIKALQSYSMIVELNNSKSLSSSLRKYLFQQMRRGFIIYPCRVAIFVVDSFFRRALISSMAKRILPFDVTFKKDYQSANNALKDYIFKVKKTNSKITEEVETLVDFISEISWANPKKYIFEKVSSSHTLRHIYDSLAIIKSDINNLLNFHIKKGRQLGEELKEQRDKNERLQKKIDHLEFKMQAQKILMLEDLETLE